jgi:inhibitor of cysteine peptidase
MKEKELIKISIEENILNKERIKMAAISSGSSWNKEKKGVDFMKKKVMVTAFVLVLCVFSVATLVQKPAADPGAYGNPADYGEIYNLLSSLDDNSDFFDWFGEKEVVDDASQGDGINSGDRSKTTPDYSDTNLQVAGVQEADIIKTDGEYIYALSWEYLYILKAENGNLTLLSKLRHLSEGEDGTTAFFELYVTGDKLIALKRSAAVYAYDLKMENEEVENPDSGGGSSSEPGSGAVAPDDPINPDPGLEPEPIPEPVPMDIMPIWPGNQSTVTAVVFDISDKSAPDKLNQLGQKGDYVSSRMIGETLYLVTNYYVWLGGMEKQDVGTYVPTTRKEGEDEKTISPDDIYIAPNPESSNYVTISGIDVSGSGDFVSSKAIMGSASNVFSSLTNLYVTNYDSETKDGYYTDKTAIIKFNLEDGIVEKAATGSVYGSIVNQFSMDEQDGDFRIATTVTKYQEIRDGDTVGISEGTTTNALYVLDEALKVIGQLTNLAEGERIYSVRFDGDTGYVVTFKQVDPLFAIDLRDPTSPKVLSALKIPGFSEYMQPFGDGLLFGLGKKTNMDGMVTGLKLSMFDVSDRRNVSELDQYVLSEEYLWTEASWNHKSILVSADRNLIAFPSFDSYFIFEYQGENGFQLKKQVKISASSLAAGYYYGTMRGLYIDQFLYIFTGSEVISLNMDGYGLTDTLKLN